MKDAKDATQKKIDLGRCGEVTLHIAGDQKRLLIEFDTDAEGFDKSGLNAFIDALKAAREKMKR